MNEMEERKEMKETVWENIGILGLLAVCTYTDIKEREIYIKVIIGFSLVEAGLFIFGCLSDGMRFPYGILVGVAIWVGSRLTKGGIGEGDALVLMTTGIALDVDKNIILLLGASMIAAAYGLLLILSGRADRKKEMPFLPFILMTYIGMLAL